MIRVNDLFKEINGQRILQGLDFEIQPGEFFVVLGESGSGKSVLLQHLIGLMRPDRGSIEIDGVDISRLSERKLLKVRRDIGFLFQDGALYDFMTVAENVAFPLKEHTDLKRKEIDRRVRDTLATVGLAQAAAKYPSQLSGGMRKRAALARAIILGSRILFCDEPTSGLDPIKSREIFDLIHSTSRQLHCTTVVSSHDIENSFRIADRLMLIHQGRMMAIGPAAELRESPSPFVQEFVRQEVG